jgi:hypothetical protein
MIERLPGRAAVRARDLARTGRVGLFQRDAAAAGAERAVLVTLSRFSPAARKAAIVATPAVDLIDGERLWELVLEQGIGVKLFPLSRSGSTASAHRRTSAQRLQTIFPWPRLGSGSALSADALEQLFRWVVVWVLRDEAPRKRPVEDRPP